MNDSEKLAKIREIVDSYPSHNELTRAIREVLDSAPTWTDTGTGPGHPEGTTPYDPRD